VTMRLSCTVMEIWHLKYCTDLDTERKMEEWKEKEEGGEERKVKGK